MISAVSTLLSPWTLLGAALALCLGLWWRGEAADARADAAEARAKAAETRFAAQRAAAEGYAVAADAARRREAMVRDESDAAQRRVAQLRREGKATQAAEEAAAALKGEK